MQRIMLAAELSKLSDRALRRAAFLARQQRTARDIWHAVDDDLPPRITDPEVPCDPWLPVSWRTCLTEGQSMPS